MHKKLIQFLLLLSIFFNIAHASIIASDDHCSHESISEYILEQSDSQECMDLCDLHHLFHLTAIITPSVTFINAAQYREVPNSKLLTYHPPFKETENKPPIA